METDGPCKLVQFLLVEWKFYELEEDGLRVGNQVKRSFKALRELLPVLIKFSVVLGIIIDE